MKYNKKYTSEYIPKLQIHQHSLLTRKVFSWHSSSTQVFITGSSSKLDHHHHCFRYLEQMVLSLNSTRHRKFYRTNHFFHAGCMPRLHVGIHLLRHLYMTMGGTHPTSMSERPAQHLYLTMGGSACHHVRKAQHLKLTQSKRPSTYILWHDRTHHLPSEERTSTYILRHGIYH